jgi:hypothetical protein
VSQPAPSVYECDSASAGRVSVVDVVFYEFINITIRAKHVKHWKEIAYKEHIPNCKSLQRSFPAAFELIGGQRQAGSKRLVHVHSRGQFIEYGLYTIQAE